MCGATTIPWPPVLAILLAGCGPSLPDQTAPGRWVRYHYWADQGAPCPEAIAQIDGLVDKLATRIERPPPENFRIDYYRVRNLEQIRDLCDQGGAPGCSVGTNVYTTEWTDDHEVTHAFLSRLGRPPDLFAEGIAVVLGCGPARWVGEPLETVDLAPLVDNDAWSKGYSANKENYPFAGLFIRSLIEQHGIGAFTALYESTPYSASQAEVEQHFRRAFGVELRDALAEWRDGPTSRDGEFCMPFDDRCDGLPDVLATGTVDTPISCVDPVSVLEVGAAPVTRLRFTADQKGRTLRIRPCDPAGSPQQKLMFVEPNVGLTTAIDGRWTELWATLNPGRYSLKVERTWDGSSELDAVAPPGGNASVQASAHSLLSDGSCTVDPIPIADDAWSVAFFTQDVADGGVLRLQPQSDRRLKLFARGLAAPPLACTGCGSPPVGCRSIEPSIFEWLRGPTSLRLQPSEGAGEVFVQILLEVP